MATAQTSSLIHRLHYASFNEKGEKAATPKSSIAESKTAAEPVKQAPPPPPTFSEKDIQTARGEAQKLGYNEGYAAAETKLNKEAAAREDAVHALLEVIANRITLAAESFAAKRQTQEDALPKLALAIAQKLTAEALKREPYAIAESLIRECVGLIAGRPVIVVTVSPARIEGLKQRIGVLTPMLQGFTGELKVEEDAALSEQDCRVEWGDGYAEHHAETVWSDIQAIIAKTTLIT